MRRLPLAAIIVFVSVASPASGQQARPQPAVASATGALSPPLSPRNGDACNSAKAAAGGAVQAANSGVDAAQGQLDLLKRGGSPAQQAQAQSTVDQA